jgi:hypothetical protein
MVFTFVETIKLPSPSNHGRKTVSTFFICCGFTLISEKSKPSASRVVSEDLIVFVNLNF